MEKSRVWEQILGLIKEEVSSANFRTWFLKAKLSGIEKDNIVITASSAFVADNLNKRFLPLIQNAVRKILNRDLNINFQVDSMINIKNAIEEETDVFAFKTEPVYNNRPNLNPKYSLKSFVVGLTNNLAYAAAQAVVQNPGLSYNPLFIYGPSGVGKTHLMQAIGNTLITKDPYIKLVYASSEKFMNDLVYSIQTKKTGDFRQKYRYCQLLLIDDIQFISGKDSTQEEFFHTFNELHSKNSQIILTSDRPPQEMIKLESRLLSRFQGGLMVDIQLPDFDTRMAILNSKLSEKGESLPENIIKMIAENITSNTRELEGKLIQILQIYKLNTGSITEDSLKKIFNKISISTNQQIDYKKVISVINQYFNTKTNDLVGPRRQKELVLPRHITMYLLYEECKLPMEKIGQILGGRDHTTILHGIEKIRSSLLRDSQIQKFITDVKQGLLSTTKYYV